MTSSLRTRLRPVSAPALVTLLVVVLLSAGGGAAAARLITGRDVKDGSLTGADIKDASVKYADLAAATRTQLTGPQGPAGDPGTQGPAGATGPQGPVGPLPTVLVASLTSCCVGLDNASTGEANAKQILLKSAASGGTYLARLDGQLNNSGALWFDYHCKLQSLPYPHLITTPWSDVPGSRRDVSWRSGKDGSGNPTGATGVPISMQAPVTAGSLGVDVRMVCWGTWDGATPPLVDYGRGVESAVLTLEPIGAVG